MKELIDLFGGQINNPSLDTALFRSFQGKIVSVTPIEVIFGGKQKMAFSERIFCLLELRQLQVAALFFMTAVNFEIVHRIESL